jgi:hypothetical protein
MDVATISAISAAAVAIIGAVSALIAQYRHANSDTAHNIPPHA